MSDTFMERALDVARAGMQSKAGGPFGAVIVRDGVIIGEGSNCVTSTNDPTAHAEIVAIRKACERTGNFSLEGATLYTSCEPCPMCYAAIAWARISDVVYAGDRAGAARAGFDDSMLWDDVALPPAARKTRMRRMDSAAADKLFDDWIAMADKTPY
jgi:tRNA(Arg) A34 adenosine deaminase TadA